MKINLDRIEQLTGRHFDNIEQLYFYLKYVIEFLIVCNKNYNKRQYEKIDELFVVITSVEFETEE